MTNHTTALDLDDIETRANAATPGPWCTDSWEIYQGTEYEPGLSMWIGETCRGTTDLEQDRADAAFVAAARTDVPALLAEIRRLRAELAEYEVLNPQQCPKGVHADWLVDSEYAHVCPWCENERLRARVAELEGGANGPDTLPAWLHWRFGPHGQPWSDVPAEDQALWEHQARAVRRAVARGGFKPRPATPAVSGAAASRQP
ncbi:hypothetical protein [Streptomyces sp. B21-101]|uniref:hypothetical protein n=1 Tax=Streptomyces sp. B21-101 TaxID=3039415 RepID=UPI002FF3AFA8